MSTQPTLFAIHPTCTICGAELVKLNSGLVCLEGHGRIVPLQEYIDRSLVPVDHSGCGKIRQQPLSKVCRDIERAQKALAKIEQRERESGKLND